MSRQISRRRAQAEARRQRTLNLQCNENYPFPEHLKIPSPTPAISIDAKSNTKPNPSPRVTMAVFAVKTACLRKILHSIRPVTNTFMEKLFSGGGHDSKKVIELKTLRTALKDRFACTEESFLDVRLEDTVSDEFDKLVKFAMAADKAVDIALSYSEEFLKENSVQTLGTDTPQASSPARPDKYPGKTQPQHHASIAETEAKAAAEAEAKAIAEATAIAEARAIAEAEAKAIAEAEAAAAEARSIAEAEDTAAKAQVAQAAQAAQAARAAQAAPAAQAAQAARNAQAAQAAQAAHAAQTAQAAQAAQASTFQTSNVRQIQDVDIGRTEDPQNRGPVEPRTGRTGDRQNRGPAELRTGRPKGQAEPSWAKESQAERRETFARNIRQKHLRCPSAQALKLEFPSHGHSSKNRQKHSRCPSAQALKPGHGHSSNNRQKNLRCPSAPPIDVQGALTGSPVTFRWVRTNADAQAERIRSLSSPTSPALANLGHTLLALKPSHWQSTTPHGEPHLWCISNLIANAWTVSAVWVTAMPAYRQSTPLHEFLQRRMGSLIAGTLTTSSPTLMPSASLPTSAASPTLPISTLPASRAGIGFTMTEALPSISWRPAPPPPPEAAHLDLQASLTLPTLSALPTKSAIPNQGLPTSAQLMPYGLPFRQHWHRHHCRRDKIIDGPWKTPLPTSAPLMPYGQPICQRRHRHRRRDKIISGTQKTPLQISDSPILHGWPFRQGLYRHRRRDKLIADTRKTSSLTLAPLMQCGQPCCQHLHCQPLSTHRTKPDGQYYRWCQRLQPHHIVHGANRKTLAKLATVLVGECVITIALSLITGTSAFSLITGTSAFSLITSYTGPFLRRLPSSQPSWWGNVLIPGSFPFDLSPVASGPPAHYK